MKLKKNLFSFEIGSYVFQVGSPSYVAKDEFSYLELLIPSIHLQCWDYKCTTMLSCSLLEIRPCSALCVPGRAHATESYSYHKERNRCMGHISYLFSCYTLSLFKAFMENCLLMFIIHCLLYITNTVGPSFLLGSAVADSTNYSLKILKGEIAFGLNITYSTMSSVK